MAFGDVYKMTLTSTYLGQTIQNVFNWKHVAGEVSTNALSWRSTFLDDIMPYIQDISNDLVHFSLLETVNWRDPSDFDVQVLNLEGNIDTEEDDPLASWLTLLYRFNRNFPGQHHGFKRFAGGVESMFQGNENGTAYATEITALANQLAIGLTASFDRVARYYVVDRTDEPEYGANPPGYPSTSVFYRGQGTQKSRKP